MTGLLIRRSVLTASGEAEMFRLLDSQFDGVDRWTFREDLNNKDYVLLVRAEDDGRLAGFTTLALYRRRFEGRDIAVICSGDTVMAPDGWGQRSLAQYWIPAIEHLRAQQPGLTLYWLLISSGYRSYRFLPVFARTFHPYQGRQTPAEDRRLLDFLATDRFGDRYDPASGVVRLPRPQLLAGPLRGIPERRLADPHVAYFAALNPGHAEGDELVCLASLERENYTAAAARLAERASRPAETLRILA